MNEAQTKRGLGKTQIILIAGIALILAAVIAVGVIVAVKLGKPAGAPLAAAQPFGTGNVIPGDDVEALKEQMRSTVEEGMFDVKMNTVWTFPDGETASADAYVANSTANTKAIYFDVTLDDTGEVVYTSPKIPVGSAVNEIKLAKDLEPGTYAASCNYHLLNDDDSVFSSTAIAVSLDIRS